MRKIVCVHATRARSKEKKDTKIICALLSKPKLNSKKEENYTQVATLT